MLVLSRRPDQKIVFPSIGVSIKLLKVRGSIAKIGIDAPRDLKILRDEVSAEQADLARSESLKTPATVSNHQLRNQLNSAKLGIHLAQRQMEQGDEVGAAQTMEMVVDHFRKADTIMAESKPERRHALLVEDDCNERELLAAYLKSFGYKIETAGDGIEALEYLQENELPDVVLLDMGMPVCGGPRAIQQIRETPGMKHLKVIGVSGADPDQMGVPIGPEGVDGWFQKPLDPAELINHLRTEYTRSVITA